MIEELHLSDLTLRNNFVNYWKANNYESAASILQNSQLNNKKNIASVFNIITDDILALENNNDPTFKANRIIVSTVAPTGLSSGSIWFEKE